MSHVFHLRFCFVPSAKQSAVRPIWCNRLHFRSTSLCNCGLHTHNTYNHCDPMAWGGLYLMLVSSEITWITRYGDLNPANVLKSCTLHSLGTMKDGRCATVTGACYPEMVNRTFITLLHQHHENVASNNSHTDSTNCSQKVWTGTSIDLSFSSVRSFEQWIDFVQTHKPQFLSVNSAWFPMHVSGNRGCHNGRRVAATSIVSYLFSMIHTVVDAVITVPTLNAKQFIHFFCIETFACALFIAPRMRCSIQRYGAIQFAYATTFYKWKCMQCINLNKNSSTHALRTVCTIYRVSNRASSTKAVEHINEMEHIRMKWNKPYLHTAHTALFHVWWWLAMMMNICAKGNRLYSMFIYIQTDLWVRCYPYVQRDLTDDMAWCRAFMIIMCGNIMNEI